MTLSYVTNLDNDGRFPILSFTNQAFPVVINSQLVEFSEGVMDLVCMTIPDTVNSENITTGSVDPPPPPPPPPRLLEERRSSIRKTYIKGF